MKRLKSIESILEIFRLLLSVTMWYLVSRNMYGYSEAKFNWLVKIAKLLNSGVKKLKFTTSLIKAKVDFLNNK